MNNISKPNDEILNEFGGLSPNNLLEIMNQSQDQVEDDDDNDPKILKSSNYIDLDTIDYFVKNNRNCFSIFSVNIECLNSKFNELVNLIKYLKEINNFQFSAICLQECWLDEDDVSDKIETLQNKFNTKISELENKMGNLEFKIDLILKKMTKY